MKHRLVPTLLGVTVLSCAGATYRPVSNLPSGNGGFLCASIEVSNCADGQEFRHARYQEVEPGVEAIQVGSTGPKVYKGQSAALYLQKGVIRQAVFDELTQQYGPGIQLGEIEAVQLVRPNDDGTIGFRKSHKVNVSRDKRDVLGLGRLAQMAFGSKYETRQDSVFKPELRMVDVKYDSDWAIIPIPNDLEPGTYTLLLLPTLLYYSFTVEASHV